MTNETNEPVELDRKDLKIMALKQELGDKSEQVADLRAELTETINLANKQIEQLVKENSELRAKLPDEDENDVEVPVEEPDSATPDK